MVAVRSELECGRRRSCSTLWDGVAQALAPNDCSRCVPTQHSEQCAYVAVNSVVPAQDDRANLNDSCIVASGGNLSNRDRWAATSANRTATPT